MRSPDLLLRLLPFLRWWPRINRDTLRADAIAGLTGAMVLVPQGVAFATIAGMPPEYGLYAAMLPAIVGALWGSSWHLVSGPTTAISIVVFATMSPLAPPGSAHYVELVLTLTLLVGIVQLALGLLRLGTLVNFVSHTVVVGFTTGAAVLIAASQARNFFGVAIPRGASVWQVLHDLAWQANRINPWITGVAVATVLASVACKRLWPRFPHMIAGLLAGSALAAVLNAWMGVERTGIGSIGALVIGLPPLSRPDLSPETLRTLAPIALAVALLALTEAVSIARAIALKSGQRIDGNQEFIGQGLSNLAGAFFSGYASSGSFNRSGLNYDSGARTPLAAVLSAVLLLVIMLFLAPWARYLPLPAMAGILFVVAWGLVNTTQIREIVHASRAEAAVLAATFIATLTLDLEFAIYIGVLLSLMLYLNRTSRPPLEDVKPVEPQRLLAFQTDTGRPDCPQMKMVRLNGSIYFGAVNHLQESLQTLEDAQPGQRHLLLAASGINFIDVAGAHLLAEEARRRRRAGGAIYLYNLKREPMDMLERTGSVEAIGRANIFQLGDDVFGALVPRMDPAICRGCSARIFDACPKGA